MNLQNSWMTNPTFLAQAAHFFGAVSVVMTTGYFNMNAGWIAGCILAVLAAFKEFWYDLRFELPKQTVGDSALDMLFYLLGDIFAIGLLFLRH